MHIVGKGILSITISLEGSSPAFKGCIDIRLDRRGGERFFVPHNFTRNFLILDSRTIFACGMSGMCTPRSRTSVHFSSRAVNVR